VKPNNISKNMLVLNTWIGFRRKVKIIGKVINKVALKKLIFLNLVHAQALVYLK
jgi:hypothetical protein